MAEKLRLLLPPELLASEDEGPNSRDRIYTLRLTFECFVWQMLKPKTPCREVVRAVQALFKSAGKGAVDEGTSGFIQARQRLPTTCWAVRSAVCSRTKWATTSCARRRTSHAGS